ncbi:hypothetical protein [Mesorhizobium sp.]|uniref:hypothetical protein n=1 Tax=Mesorhizobium sp. TaxID=1871066 RepID=UPI000FE8EC54|nr:hypothetical protein [Mesorhizobium sp.]RWM04997.1 MAG: hypothetical protein EOR71_25225 [Mesorhizobium sp.]
MGSVTSNDRQDLAGECSSNTACSVSDWVGMADLVGIAFSSLSKDNASRQKKLALSDVDPSERSAAAVATPA